MVKNSYRLITWKQNQVFHCKWHESNHISILPMVQCDLKKKVFSMSNISHLFIINSRVTIISIVLI